MRSFKTEIMQKSGETLPNLCDRLSKMGMDPSAIGVYVRNEASGHTAPMPIPGDFVMYWMLMSFTLPPSDKILITG